LFLHFLDIVSDIGFRDSDFAAMRTELFQIQNFIDGQFVEPLRFFVIPSEVEESLDISWLSSI